MFKAHSSSRGIPAVLATAALVLSGIAGVSAPAHASDTKKVTISGFAPNSVALTASMQQRIKKFIEANDEYLFVSCVGFADRAGSQKSNNALGKGRAEAGCDQAVSASTEVKVVSSRGRWDKIRSGASVRRVEITLSKTATAASAGFTTYFEYMGGEEGIAQVKTLADGTLVLPTPTRPGYEFLGWFSDQYNGTKIGNGGDTYNPNRTRILWAQWFVPLSGGSSASGVATISFSLTQWVEGGFPCAADEQTVAVLDGANVNLGTATFSLVATSNTTGTDPNVVEECAGTVSIPATSGAFPTNGQLSLRFTPAADSRAVFSSVPAGGIWTGANDVYTFPFAVASGANTIEWDNGIDTIVP